MTTKDLFSYRGAIAALASLGLVASCGASKDLESPDEPPARPETLVGVGAGAGAGDYDPRSVLVRFKDAPHRASLRAAQATALARVGGTFLDRDGDGVYDRFANLDRRGRLMKIDLPEGATVEAAIASLRGDPAVEYAEPNYLVRTTATPDDARFGQLYGLHNTGQTGGTADADLDAPEAWEITAGSHDVVVGVIDTGVDTDHEDLVANLWVNPGEIAHNGIDDDGNGVIDDVHGYDAIDGSGDPFDDGGHGTHCAGIIGAVGDNGVGITGVSWNVSIMGLKSLFGGGQGTTAEAISAIDYAISMRHAGVNLRALSASWGGTFFSEALKDAIEAANAAEILFVASAGNGFGRDNDATPFYPASYEIPNVISVAATDDSDQLATFSNVGLTSVDLGAPGVQVMSTVPRDGYEWKSGTSMAAPYVAGAAALLLSARPSLTTAEIKDLLVHHGDPLPSLQGKTVSGARLNVAKAIVAAGPVPGFDLSAALPALALNQGDTGSYPLQLSAIAGFTGEVSLTVTSSPPIDATLTATPPLVGAPGSSAISVVTHAATEPGFYNLTITATSGSLASSRTVTLLVRPLGTVTSEFLSTRTPAAIPLRDPTGLNNFLYVGQRLDLQYAEVELDVTQPWVGVLRVTLTSPSGTEVVLHERGTGSTGSNIHRRYVLPTEFTDEQAQGHWRLHVDNELNLDEGTLDRWRLSLVGLPSAPTFALGAVSPELHAQQGGSSSSVISVAARNGYGGDVALSVTSSPPLAGGQLSITPASVTAPGNATLHVSTSCDTAPGRYQLTVRGQGGQDAGGSILKTTRLTLVVSAFGEATVLYPGTEPPLPIRDNHPVGRTSAVVVTEGFPISALTAEVHITHPRIMDLVVELVAPDGTTVRLHDREGRVANNLHRTYQVSAFNGRAVTGEWRLKVRDEMDAFTGTLDRWTLRATGSLDTAPLHASFTYAVDVNSPLRASFADTSTGSACGGGSGIVGWSWDFGDGATSSSQHPSHTYATGGTYPVTLTVTHASGATSAVTETVAVRSLLVLSIERVLRNRATFEFIVDLKWSNAQGALVELHRNGLLVDLPANDGAHRDQFRRYETSFVWKLCEQQRPICSNEVSVVFGSSSFAGSGEPTEATIVMKQADGSSTSRLVRIEEVP